MSYCVHCGVELAASERDCPLCGTLVQNPYCAWEKPEQMPYPETVDIRAARIDRRYARRLVALLMAVPALVVLLLDLVDGGGVRWSLYVMGGLALLYCWVVIPALFRFSKPYVYVLIDVVSLSGYLLMVALLSGDSGWFFGLVLPLLLLTGLVLKGALLAIRRLQLAPLRRAALVCLLLAVYLLGLEALISLYAGAPMLFRWSFYAAIPAGVIGLTLWLLEGNEPLKKEIEKRLFI